MKYDNRLSEAAHCLVEAGKAEQTIGVLSEDGVGPQWQALVLVARYHLMRVGGEHLDWSGDVARHVQPGHEYLMWLVEEEDGRIITRMATDVDRKDHEANMAVIRDGFAAAIQNYGEPIDLAAEWEEANNAAAG